MIVPNIISNPERQVRVDRMHREMARQRISEYKLWPSVHIANKPTRTAISIAHKNIVRWASNEGLPEVCIMEDDVWFPSENGWQYYLNKKPAENFDLYLGGITRGDLDEHKITTRYTGQFCYIITDRFYDAFLSTDERLDIDGAMANRGRFPVCYPYACFTYWGWSDNAMATMNLNHLLVGREINGFGLIKNEADAKRLTDLANLHSGLTV